MRTWTPEARRARAAGTAKPSPAPAPATADPVLKLQRAVGNGAVQRLLAQRSAADAVAGPVAPEVEREIGAARGGGTGLDGGTREAMEGAFGADFGGVRVHADARADRLARSLQARAFTTGSDVFFRQGEPSPGSPGGRALLAHELTHVVQQSGAPAAGAQRSLEVGPADDPLEREADQAAAAVVAGVDAAPSSAASAAVRRQPAPAPAPAPAPGAPAPVAAAPTGTPANAAAFFGNPAAEKDAGLQAALKLLTGHAPTVKVEALSFRVGAERTDYLGMTEPARSYWEKDTPVIELRQEDLDAIAVHQGGTPNPQRMHKLVQTVGHEILHLSRARNPKLTDNPVKPVYEKEVEARMDRVRQNWVEYAATANKEQRQSLGLKDKQVVKRFNDFPEATRQSIEKGATATSYIQGLFESSSYLVEEVYALVEEVHFIAVEQADADAAVVTAGRERLNEVAFLLYRINNMMEGAGNTGELLNPDLVAKARAAITASLRKTYPRKGDPAHDSFEVILYLSSLRGSMPPLMKDGVLYSVVPPGARVP